MAMLHRTGLILTLALCGTLGVSAETALPEPVFYRGININGPALVIDGRQWEGKGAANYENRDRPIDAQQVPLNPPTDPARAQMLKAFTYTPNGKNRAVLTSLPPETYSVFLHAWEDNYPAVCDVFVNGRKVLAGHNSGTGGSWYRLGPWPVEVADGRIEITSQGGHANWSGIEIWKGRVEKGSIAAAPKWSQAQVHFFESKVRPLLAAKCYDCHSARVAKVKGGLMLDNRASVLRGGSGGPVILPGSPDASRLIKAIRYQDKTLRMPPTEKGGKLDTHEIEALTEWVRMGAPDPRDGEALLPKKFDLAEARKHWAYRPVAKAAAPSARNSGWPVNDVDRFILSRLEQAHVRPNPDAPIHTLIRRSSFDLIGLPPTPEQIARWSARFKTIGTNLAMGELVEELLASPHYGERWGRHWMDLVRYADTTGDNSDYPVPQLYRYRNYIIDSFNADKPYDQFIREQIAGDLLPAKNQARRNEQVIATGYVASARRFGSVVDRYPTHLTIEDTLDNLSKTFMGMTLTCARCHDHKFEAISIEDYYGLYGIFASTLYAFPGIELLKVQKDFVPLISQAEQDRLLGSFRKKEQELQKRHDEVLAHRNRLEKEKDLVNNRIGKAQGTEKEELYRRLNEFEAQIVTARGQIRTAAGAIEKHKLSSPSVANAYAVQDGTVSNARLQLKGEPEQLGAEVPRKFIDVLGGQRLSGDAVATSGRLQLAEWIADAKNPLTARVMVNRIWQFHFGKALVETVSNFGVRGLPPSHPELLDWLAAEFVASGWSIKHVHRLIMNSRTYQLSSEDTDASLALNADNKLLWRFNRQRLDAEQLRDAMMFVSGTLDLHPLTEAHPFPKMGKWEFTQHHPFKDSYPTSKRAVYQMTRRLTVEPYWQTFDGPDRNQSTPERDESVTTVQSLYLLNNEFVHEQAKALAARLGKSGTDEQQRIARGFEMTIGRLPSTSERVRAEAFLTGYRQRLSADGCEPAEVDTQAWRAFCRVLFKLNEFLYVD